MDEGAVFEGNCKMKEKKKEEKKEDKKKEEEKGIGIFAHKKEHGVKAEDKK
jgi:cytoskeletal protein CcmA (bactofilin family)